MTKSGRQEAILRELECAAEELAAADVLLGAGLPRVALTRPYFAVFHAVRALLQSEDLEPHGRADVHHTYNEHFVRAGRAGFRDSRLLARLQKFREEADYARSFPVDDEGAREELNAARDFVQRAEAVLVRAD